MLDRYVDVMNQCLHHVQIRWFKDSRLCLSHSPLSERVPAHAEDLTVRTDRIPRDGLFLADSIPQDHLQRGVADLCAGTGVVATALWLRGGRNIRRYELSSMLSDTRVATSTGICLPIPSYTCDLTERAAVDDALQGVGCATINPPQLPGLYRKDVANCGGNTGLEFIGALLENIVRGSFIRDGGVLYLVGFKALVAKLLALPQELAVPIWTSVVAQAHVPLSPLSRLKTVIPDEVRSCPAPAWPDWIEVSVVRLRGVPADRQWERTRRAQAADRVSGEGLKVLSAASL